MPEIITVGESDTGSEPVEVVGAEDAIVAANRALIDEIHALGGNIPPSILLQVQLDMLIDLVYPQGSPVRKLYDLMVEDRLTGVFEHIKSQVVRERLNPLGGTT